MKARLIVAGVLTCGALIVLPAETASACTLGIGLDCDVHIGRDGVHSVDHSQDYVDPTKWAQPAPREKVQQWRTNYWFDYPRSAEASQDWLGNLFRGGTDNPNYGARTKARDAAGRKADLYDQYGLRPHEPGPAQESGRRMTTTGGGEHVPCYIGSC